MYTVVESERERDVTAWDLITAFCCCDLRYSFLFWDFGRFIFF